MPTYEYECESCGHHFEAFQRITARPLKKCPRCAKLRLHRLIGAGAGVIFKGSGFYQTDYRSESYKKAAEADKPAQSSSTSSDGDSAKADGKKDTAVKDSAKAKPTTKNPEKRKAS
jgi:putative FmdB family regulatory protein